MNMVGVQREMTLRQLEVWRLLALGHSNKQIANALGITQSSVKSHLDLLYVKLNVRNRTQAAVLWGKK